jgi:hypothetical protein
MAPSDRSTLPVVRCNIEADHSTTETHTDSESRLSANQRSIYFGFDGEGDLQKMMRHFFFRSRGVFAAIIIVSVHYSKNVKVHAFSTGAGACPSGVAAVSGFHLTPPETDSGQPRDIEQIPFLESGILFTINDFPVDPTTSVSVRPMGLYKFAVVAAATFTGNSTSSNNSTTSPFRGVLLRVQQGSDGAALALGPINNEYAKIVSEAICALPAVAITHSNSDLKTEFAGLFTTDSTDPPLITVDITVVFSNNDTSSHHTYQQFLIGLVAEDNNSTESSIFPSETPSDVLSLVPSSIPSSESDVPSLPLPSEIQSSVPTLTPMLMINATSSQPVSAPVMAVPVPTETSQTTTSAAISTSVRVGFYSWTLSRNLLWVAMSMVWYGASFQVDVVV